MLEFFARGRWRARHGIALLLVPLVWLLSLRVFCAVARAEGDLGDPFNRIREGLYGFSPSIELSDLKVSVNELTRVVTYLIKDDPYLFYVDDRLSYSYSQEGYVLRLKPDYTMTKSEVEIACRELEVWIQEMADGVCGDDTEVALRLHDMILHSVAYDEGLENDNIYKLYKSGTGTCQAYTMLYLALLREVGIDSHFIASDSIAHIWNLVKIDGEWYHADLTWDDGDVIGRRHFLCSDQTAIERGHRDWYSSVDVVCDSERFRDADFDVMLWREPKGGDLDHSGDVEFSDLLLLRAHLDFGREVCGKCADADGNVQVDWDDAALLRRKFLLGD